MRRPPYAPIAATVALLVSVTSSSALAGHYLKPGYPITSYTIVNGTVQGRDLARETLRASNLGAIGSAEIRAGAVGPTEVGTQSVDSDDVVPEALTGSDVQDGTIQLVDLAPSAQRAILREAQRRLAARKASRG